MVDEGEVRVETDAALMEEAGFNVTRMAEFAWVKLEPREGEFDFSWLDRAVETLGRHGVKTILCTPTPTMPKWVYDKYPEAVAEDEAGHKQLFGNRQINCYTSEAYRALSKKVTKAMAAHYKDNPHVIAWQLDNEFWGPYCYCAQCENKFRAWLQKKYGSIDRLNEAYGTIFWSQSYADFSEVHLPRHPHSSPSLFLDYKRFHSENVISFAGEQAEILREANSAWTITHNMMGFAPNIDYFELGKLLDVTGFDYYYASSFGDPSLSKLDLCRRGAAELDLMRGIKNKNFWIIENNAGPAGWETYGRNMIPGEIRRMTFQNIAHGCDAQIWFRFRTSRYGTEQYWHGLLGHDGKKNRRYREAQETSFELKKLFGEIDGSTVQSAVAIVYDYEDVWALGQQPNSRKFNYVAELVKTHSLFAQKGVHVDFVPMNADFSGYKVLVLQSKYLLEEEAARRVEDFVKAGGVLLATYRSGVKNNCNVPYAKTLPGYLRAVCGVCVEEYEAVQDAYSVSMEGERYRADTLADWVIPETAELLAAYDVKYLHPYAAVTENAFGSGKAFYVGTVLEPEALGKVVVRAVQAAGLQTCDLPAGVELVTRQKDGTAYTFILNHSEAPCEIEISGYEMLSGQSIESRITVDGNDVKVVRRPCR